MAKNSCHDTYRTNLDKRRTLPLREGGYKVAESILRLQRMLDTVDVIERRLNSGEPIRPGEALGCCTGDDKGNWLKRLPAEICAEIGYNLIPALRLNVADVAVLDRSALAVVDLCEKARQWLASEGVGHEYAAMKGEGSMLRRLLKAAMALGS